MDHSIGHPNGLKLGSKLGHCKNLRSNKTALDLLDFVGCVDVPCSGSGGRPYLIEDADKTHAVPPRGIESGPRHNLSQNPNPNRKRKMIPPVVGPE